MGGPRWTPERKDALINTIKEAHGEVTLGQIAEWYGACSKTVKSIMQEYGLTSRTPQSVGKRRGGIPKNRVLVAMTCRKCGDLLSAKHYLLGPDGYWDSACNICRNAASKKSKIKHGNKGNIWTSKMQDASIPTAVNHGARWTQDDDKHLIDNKESPILEQAIALGRTWKSVISRRELLGITKANKTQKDFWVISLPEEMQALKAHYARLGVPPEQWDWDDDEVASKKGK